MGAFNPFRGNKRQREMTRKARQEQKLHRREERRATDSSAPVEQVWYSPSRNLTLQVPGDERPVAGAPDDWVLVQPPAGSPEGEGRQ